MTPSQTLESPGTPGRFRSLLGLQLVIPLWSAPATAQEGYPPDAGQCHPTTVYWVDTHLHSNTSSVDAYLLGNRLDPDDAYRFVKGQPVTASNGAEARLRRPLDFLVVADHAEALGLKPRIEANAAALRNLRADQRRLLRRLWEEA